MEFANFGFVRYDIIVKDIAVFLALYLSLYVAFVLGIYTLDRAYVHFIAVVEESSLPIVDKLGCRVQELSDVTYVLFTLSFGDNLKDVLSEGRQDATNACGGLKVLLSPYKNSVSTFPYFSSLMFSCCSFPSQAS